MYHIFHIHFFSNCILSWLLFIFKIQLSIWHILTLKIFWHHHKNYITLTLSSNPHNDPVVVRHCYTCYLRCRILRQTGRDHAEPHWTWGTQGWSTLDSRGSVAGTWHLAPAETLPLLSSGAPSPVCRANTKHRSSSLWVGKRILKFLSYLKWEDEAFSQDGGVGKHALPPHTTTAQITTRLQNKYHPDSSENQAVWKSNNQRFEETTFIQMSRRGRDVERHREAMELTVPHSCVVDKNQEGYLRS